MQLVIIAGGKGTRLQSRLGGRPKPMADVCGRPLLEHQVRLAARQGIEDIWILTGYGAEFITEHFQNGRSWGVRIRYLRESEPLGTAGAVLQAIDRLAEQFVVTYGDTMLNLDFGRLWQAHQAASADATLFLHPNDHPQDSDLVEIDGRSRVTRFHPYPHAPGQYYANLVNAAVYVLDRRALPAWRGRRDLMDFGKHLFPEMLKAGAVLHGYCSPEYVKDAGTPERLDKVIADWESGRVQRALCPTPAVFLDRDGTLNVECNRVKEPGELVLLEGTAQAVRRLNQAGFRVVVVTNQPVVARGDCSEQDLRQIHNKLESLLGECGAYLDAIYYCPHHPHKGFPGERPELKVACACRKPAPGLIEQARGDLNLDLPGSWLIGDSTTDIQTARNAGVRPVLVRTGHGGRDGAYAAVAEYTFATLPEAVEFILSRGVAA